MSGGSASGLMHMDVYMLLSLKAGKVPCSPALRESEYRVQLPAQVNTDSA